AMNARRFGLTGFLILICLGSSFAAEGLSTSFVDIQINGVPLGKPYVVRNSQGEGIHLRNLGKELKRVQIQILTPAPGDLRGGAQPIPDTGWVKVDPVMLDIPGGAVGQSQILLTVPRDKAYRGKTFQVMIWSHSVALDGHSMEIGTGLLSRLRFTIK